MNDAQTGKSGPGVTVVGDDDCTTAAAQRHRVLEYLRDVGPANTMFLRDRLNVMMPASRVKELREQGHKISTTLLTINDSAGRPHPRVARYVLVSLAEVQG